MNYTNMTAEPTWLVRLLLHGIVAGVSCLVTAFILVPIYKYLKRNLQDRQINWGIVGQYALLVIMAIACYLHYYFHHR